MKWYESIKVKLIGSFLLVSFIFLLFLLISFSMLKDSQIEQNALEQARLSTLDIVSDLKKTQNKMEENAIVLASITAEKFSNNRLNTKLILAFMNSISSKDVSSGGVWFEPYTLDQKKDNGVIFFYRNNNKFILMDNYSLVTTKNYRKMEFYVLGKKMKRGETFWTKVYTDPVTKIRMITVISPIYVENNFLGVASIDMKVGYDEVEMPSNSRYMMALDRSGTIVMKSLHLSKILKTSNIDSLLKIVKIGIETNRVASLDRYKNEVLELSKNSFEIDYTDAEMIVNLIHTSSKNIVIKTYFLDNDPILKTDTVVALFYFADTGMTLVVGTPQEAILSEINKNYNTIIWITLLTTMLVALLGSLLLHKYFVAPLENINMQLHEDHYRLLECNDRGEIGELVKNLNLRTIALKDAQYREQDEMNKRLINEKLLIQQSKMAAMGEMMDAVAHQWKQPLNALSMYSDIVKSDFEDGIVDKPYMNEFSQNIHIQIDHMVNTLDEFRSFFRPSKTEEDFNMTDIIKSVLFLTKDEFMKNRITVELDSKKEIVLHGSKNEFKHLILNIINNAKDAFNDNDIKERRFITIRLLEDKGRDKIEIEDNAGGIPKSILADIFKANVTTKAEGKGTGIGLYMSMQIADKFNAELLVDNRNNGACFSIVF